MSKPKRFQWWKKDPPSYSLEDLKKYNDKFYAEARRKRFLAPLLCRKCKKPQDKFKVRMLAHSKNLVLFKTKCCGEYMILNSV
jgi:hypothetical protein